MPKKKQQTQPELCKDIVHIVNVMLSEANEEKRDKLYDRFHNMIAQVKVADFKEEDLLSRLVEAEDICKTAVGFLKPGYAPHCRDYFKGLLKEQLKQWKEKHPRYFEY